MAPADSRTASSTTGAATATSETNDTGEGSSSATGGGDAEGTKFDLPRLPDLPRPRSWDPVACDEDTAPLLEVAHAEGRRGPINFIHGYAAQPLCGALEIVLVEDDTYPPPRGHNFLVVRDEPDVAVYEGTYDSAGWGPSHEAANAIEFLEPWDPRVVEDPGAQVPLEVHIEIDDESLRLSVDAVLPFCVDWGDCYCPCE